MPEQCTVANEIKERMMNARGGNQSIVTRDILEDVVVELSRDENDVLDEAMQLLNAWKMKRLDYDVMKRSWKLVDEIGEGRDGKGRGNGDRNGKGSSIIGKRSVFGEPCDKVSFGNRADFDVIGDLG